MAFFESCGSLGMSSSLISYDGRFQFGDLLARHFAHLLVLVVGEHVLRFGQIGQGRAETFRRLDDRFQLLVVLVQLHELFHVGDHFGVGELLPQLLVFEFQSVQTLEDRIVCHSLPFSCRFGDKDTKSREQNQIYLVLPRRSIYGVSQSTKSRGPRRGICGAAADCGNPRRGGRAGGVRKNTYLQGLFPQDGCTIFAKRIYG